MAIRDLKDLFLHTLKDIYYAERQISKALPKMAENADSGDLQDLFKAHLDETRGQIERLEKVFELLGAEGAGGTLPGDRGDHRRGGRADR